MVANARLVVDPVADLRRRLARRVQATPAALRAPVLRWWGEQGLAEHPGAVGRRIALALLDQPRREHQRAGAIVLHELLADQLGTSDLPAFEALLARGVLADATTVDYVALHVLGTLLLRVRCRGDVARVLVTWGHAETVWQRRAACVALTVLASQGDAALPGLAQLIFTLCKAVVWSLDRRDQSAVGWLLCELSHAEPVRVEAFFRRHARFMSRACARQAIARLPAARHKELLAHWKRATTLAR